MFIRSTAPFLVTLVILAHSAPGDARAGAAYDFAIRLTGQIQVNYVETIISIYRRSMPTVFGEEIIWSAEFDLVQKGRERLIETREEVSRLLLREYEIPQLILPESPSGVPTEHVLSVEDYHARDDVLLRYSATRIDLDRNDADLSQPVLRGCCNELWLAVFHELRRKRD